jgi:hypothetical protein
MRYKVFTATTLFGLLIVPLARAQWNQPVRADIPFDFGVANMVLPAGNYQFTYSHGTRSVLIRSLNQNAAAMVILNSVQANRSQQGKAQLVFHRLGSTYFLWQLFHGHGAETGGEVPRSRSERDLIARLPGSHVERASIIVPAK